MLTSACYNLLVQNMMLNHQVGHAEVLVKFYLLVCSLLQVCPVCAMRVGVDMVAHITLQHGNIFKISFSSYFIYNHAIILVLCL